ncbi:phage portal protein [Bacteroides uniformis]|uniref:phage portal protein n=1 Tax=Bacteroides uniformis TaxID=820 RepID=UPI0020300C0B|nr:phage portal protein [Bacteroides uniformis]MCM1957582.1 phage portal protein [Bacteroides uniformis]
MGFLDKLIDRFKRENSKTNTAAAGYNPRAGAVSLLPQYGAAPLNIAAVYRCVEILSNSVANLPLQYLKERNGVFRTDTDARLHYLLAVQPNENMNAFDFWAQVVRYMLLHGNAYIIPQYDAGSMDFSRLILCTPGSVAHDTINDSYTVTDATNGLIGTFAEDEVIHIKNYTRDGKNGISTLAFARQCVEIAAAGDDETLNRFKNGGNVRGIVGNDKSVRGFGEYQDNELQKTADDLDARFRNGERIVSLPGQVQFSAISISSTDMQFLETRKFTVREICRFFNVPPQLVYDATAENYKTAELTNVAFLSNSLNPILRRIENELQRKIVAPSLCCKRKIQFDRRGIYACDLDSKVKYIAQTIAAGVYTVNEWRKEENKAPVEGGDTVLISANLRKL